MLSILDMRTLYVMVAVVAISLGICFLHFFISHKTYPGVGKWVAAIALLGISLFLIGMRDILSDFFSIIIANILMFSSFAFLFLGFRIFCGKQPNYYFHSVLLVIYSLIITFFTYIMPNINIKVSLISLVVSIYMGLCAFLLVVDVKHRFGKPNKLLILTLIIISMLFLFRICFYLFFTGTIDNFITPVVDFQLMIPIITSILLILFVIGLIQLSYQRLEKELQDDQKQLKNAINKTEIATKAKSEFLANMSHEIRTPLNGVVGMLDLVSGTQLDEEQQDFIVSAQQSSESLLMIINDILDFSKIEAGKLEVEETDFDLGVTMDSLIDVLAIKAHEKGIEIAYLIEDDIPQLLRGDPGRLKQILINLAGNAVKFVDKGDVFIKVFKKIETRQNIELLFEVKDTGIGIPEEKIDTLFNSFTQVDTSTTRKFGGTGLGLTISKQLVELMNGDIGIKSKLGKGSTFWFTALFDKQSIQKKNIIFPDNIKGTKVLIVDRNITNHEIFGEYLKSWQCRVGFAQSCRQALEQLNNDANDDPYQIALINMQMPEMSGQELGKIIKQTAKIKDTLLVILSSFAARGDSKIVKQAGFQAFLTKPVKKEKLFDCIRMLLSTSQNEFVTSYKVEEVKKSQLTKDDSQKILLVEDNKINQKVAAIMLEKLGHDVVIANNGQEAVDQFKNNKFDMIFMDIQMPVMSGEEATKAIRDIEKGTSSHIPIVALTANAIKGDKERFFAAGMDAYIAKPLKRNDLIKVFN